MSTHVTRRSKDIMCISVTSFEFCQSQFCARDCLDLLQLGFSKSGVYQVYPGGVNTGYDVYCDMETDGGGGW